MKKAIFLENAKLLNAQFGIVPLMYGSLGLEYITDESLNADDIDILIPDAFIHEHWDTFQNVLADHGYILMDEHEHTFQKDGICFSYASLEELETFAQINPSDIASKHDSGASFKLLSLEQYLKVYMASSQDGYRVNIRKKKDADKILFIQKHLR